MRTRSFRLLTFLLLAASLLLACDLGTSTGGTSAKPTILIQSPANGSQFQEGAEITIQSVATDASGIATVDLIVDGAVVRTDKPSAGQSGPLFAFAQKWQATAGAHTIGVRAYNAAGIPSDPVTIAVIVSPSAAQVPSPSPGLATTVPSPAAVLSPPTLTPTVTAMATVSPTAAVTSTVTAMATVSSTAAVAAPPPVVLPPCPPGSAMPSGMLFCDDFASQAISESKGWYFHTDPDVDFTWSPYIATMAVKKQDWFATNGTSGKYDNFGAEIEAQPLSDGYAEYGLLFRTSGDVNNFYVLAITTDGGYFMDKEIAGNWSDVHPVKWTPAPSVRQGKNKNLIGVIAQGNTFALYINHVLVNTVTDDSLPGSGLVGVYVYNSTDSANAIVEFSLLTILTPDQARAEWGNAAPAPSSSSQPTTAPTTTTATSAPPGLYVTALGMDQAQPAHGQNVNFTVSFVNTGSGDLSVKWKVYIYRADTPAKSNTESAAVPATFHPGPTTDQPVPMNFKLGSTGNDCDYFFARVDTLDVNNKPTDLTTTDGKVFEKGFSVCK